MAAAIDIQPFFLDGPRGRLLCLWLTPSGRVPRGGVLYLHPFAEEMHKSRRMAALQARALAAAGFAVLQIDLTGCGDSTGDFADASWSLWREDARLAHAWLAARGTGPITLWGLRTGALLAAGMAAELEGVARLLLWQPVSNGDLFMNQFLRIRLAGEMLAEGQSQSGTKVLRAALAAGETLEVGGYGLSPAMSLELSGLRLDQLRPPCPVDWFEIVRDPAAPLPPASQRVVEVWREGGSPVRTHGVQGDPFWITQEITECPGLLEATTGTMAAGPER